MSDSNKPDSTTARLGSEAEREQLRIQVAKLHYELELTQSAIAKRTGLNRWQVARLLREARADGTVRIEIAPRANRLPHEEAALQKRFGLREAIVIQDQHDDDVALSVAAQVSARYLADLHPSLIAVSWGRTMTRVATWLPTRWTDDVDVVLLNGATNICGVGEQTNDVAERFALAGRGRATLLPVPAILGSARTREALERDAIIERVLALAEAAPIACMSMGTTDPDSVLVASGYLDTHELESLVARGAVGDILGRFIDAEGAIAMPELNGRTLGFHPERLREKAYSIGVAVGARKHRVVRACLTAGYINVLITDAATAAFLLQGGGDE